MKILSSNQMRTLEKTAVDNGASYYSLMKKAGKSVAKTLIKNFNPKKSEKICILCGKGNNGGDGFVCAKKLSKLNFNVTIILVDNTPCTDDSKQAFNSLNENKIDVIKLWEDEKKSYAIIDKSSYIIDAIYGIGFKGKLNNSIKNIVDIVNNSNKKVLCVDIPSGVECDTGKVINSAFIADITISFSTYKPAHILYPSMDYCGKTIVKQVGIDKDILTTSEYLYKTIDKNDIYTNLPKRKISSHKGSCGTLMTVCGSYGMAGAAKMCINSALNTGVGLVKAVVPKEIYSILATNLSEPVFLPIDTKGKGVFQCDNAQFIIEQSKKCNACLIGCGISLHYHTTMFVSNLIKNISVPIIIDADGINAISKHIDILKAKKSTIILTPHPAELARLCNVDVLEIQNNRIKYATKIATEYGVIVALKGANTVVANNLGKVYINTTGNVGMAKAGSGDVLAGIISSLVAQNIEPYTATKMGVYLHGVAGDIACDIIGNISMLPTDTINMLPTALNNK